MLSPFVGPEVNSFSGGLNQILLICLCFFSNQDSHHNPVFECKISPTQDQYGPVVHLSTSTQPQDGEMTRSSIRPHLKASSQLGDVDLHTRERHTVHTRIQRLGGAMEVERSSDWIHVKRAKPRPSQSPKSVSYTRPGLPLEHGL